MSSSTHSMNCWFVLRACTVINPMHPITSTTKWFRGISLNPSTMRARTTERARGLRPDEGVSLVEVIVAFTILLITVLPLGYLLVASVSAAGDARERSAALQLADSWIEILSNTTPPTRADGALDTNDPVNPATLVNATTTQIPSTTLAGTVFSVSADYAFQSVTGQGATDLCTSGNAPSPSHPAVLKLQVTVTWKQRKQHTDRQHQPSLSGARVRDGRLPRRAAEHQHRPGRRSVPQLGRHPSGRHTGPGHPAHRRPDFGRRRWAGHPFAQSDHPRS